MNRIFIGYDSRQIISYTALQQSILETAKTPVAITPLAIEQLPITRQGLTPFTYTRFLVPWLCDYQGHALFLDADMLALADIGELFALADDNCRVQVVKNSKRFEWASLMLFNCARCLELTPKYVETANDLHRISWAGDDEIGALPAEWNHLVGYDEPRPDAKLVHYTQGIPYFPETRKCEYSRQWWEVATRMTSSEDWGTLMGNSVHAIELMDGQKIPRLVVGEAAIREYIERQAN